MADLDAFYAELDDIKPAGGETAASRGLPSESVAEPPPSSDDRAGLLSGSPENSSQPLATTSKPASLLGALPRAIASKAVLMRPAVISKPPQPSAASTSLTASSLSAATASHAKPASGVAYPTGPAAPSSGYAGTSYAAGPAQHGNPAGALPYNPFSSTGGLSAVGSGDAPSSGSTAASSYASSSGHGGYKAGSSRSASAGTAGQAGASPTQHDEGSRKRKFLRTCAGEVWEDRTLAEWPENDVRLFCGDLGNEVTDDMLAAPFKKYKSFAKAKIVRDRNTHKSRGYGFISFTEPMDALSALKEMHGAYIGNRPVRLKRADITDKAYDVVTKKQRKDEAKLKGALSGGK